MCRDNGIILEVETGIVGEEDGLNREGIDKEKLYTTPEDMLAVYEALSPIKDARFMLAATFGNVHGVYKPGNVVLTPYFKKWAGSCCCQAWNRSAVLVGFSWWIWFWSGRNSGKRLRTA